MVRGGVGRASRFACQTWRRLPFLHNAASALPQNAHTAQQQPARAPRLGAHEALERQLGVERAPGSVQEVGDSSGAARAAGRVHKEPAQRHGPEARAHGLALAVLLRGGGGGGGRDWGMMGKRVVLVVVRLLDSGGVC